MAMDSTSNFKFRDHTDMDFSAVSYTSSDISSTDLSDPVYVDDNDEDDSDLQSMTAKGIKHLCSELVELKAASDEDFQRNIFQNYSTFVRVFEEAEETKNELMKLKAQVCNQKTLVNELGDGVIAELLADDTIEVFTEDSVSDEPYPLTRLKDHINDVSENLDTFLSENRVDEALDVLQMEDDYIQRLQLDGGFSADLLELYSTAISKRKIGFRLKLVSEAGNPRITAPELQKALVGLVQLGNIHIATQLLLKHYHTRIAARLHNFQDSEAFSGATSMRELARFVFSLISQAARSFQVLCGESFYLAQELAEWVSQEIEAFAACFSKYIRSISEISGGLFDVVQSIEFAISYCSLLRNQHLDTLPGLIKCIRPSVVEVLDMHINHFKKVLGILTESDTWVLCKYHVSEIMDESNSSEDVCKETEYCCLTTSGRKLLTLLQGIAEDMSPLVSLEMENLVIKFLIDLIMEYVLILEKVISMEIDTINQDKYVHGISSVIQMQKISTLASLSTLEGLFSRIIRFSFHSVDQYETGAEHNPLDSFSLIGEKCAQVRDNFCSQFACRVMSTQYDQQIIPEVNNGDEQDSSISQGMMPSMTLQVLFLELRKIEIVAEHAETRWLEELLTDLIEATASEWTSENNMILNNDEGINQFILDIYFLVEMVKHGRYLSNKPILLVTRMKSCFLSAGFDPNRDIDKDKWASAASAEAIAKLLEIEKQLNILQAGESSIPLEVNPHETMYGGEMECCLSFSEKMIKPEESMGDFGPAIDSLVTENKKVDSAYHHHYRHIEEEEEEEDGPFKKQTQLHNSR